MRSKNFHGSCIEATLHNIHEETDMKLSFRWKAVTVTGHKENIQKAQARILTIENNMVRV